jgi:hypothetical protein
VALVVAEEDLPVGPLDLQGAVEPLDLAVLPGAVRSDGEVLGVDDLDRVLKVAADDVVLGVVGDDLVDPDAVVGEERPGPAVRR